MSDKPTLDLFSAEVHDNPYPAYSELRRNHPVFYDSDEDFWIVSRYEDVALILRDSQRFSNSIASFEHTLLGADGSSHMRARRIVGQMFGPGVMAALEEQVHNLVRSRIDQIAAVGQCELIGDLAGPLPLEIMAWLLDIERTRIHDLRRWSAALLTSVRIGLSEQAVRDAADDIRECHAFLQEHMARKSSSHSDKPIKWLVGDKERLSVHELAEIGMLLIVAGAETTTNIVGNAAALLARDMPLQQMLRANTGFIPSFVEEALRYEAPIQRVARRAVAATTVAGVHIPKDARVLLLIGSANRDLEKFSNPDGIEVDRQPNHHISFGTGPHFCLGARLARLEAGTILEELLGRLPPVAVASTPNAVQLVPSFVVRGLSRLELVFTSDPNF